jgi:hypothetical protein
MRPTPRRFRIAAVAALPIAIWAATPAIVWCTVPGPLVTVECLTACVAPASDRPASAIEGEDACQPECGFAGVVSEASGCDPEQPRDRDSGPAASDCVPAERCAYCLDGPSGGDAVPTPAPSVEAPDQGVAVAALLDASHRVTRAPAETLDRPPPAPPPRARPPARAPPRG